MIDEQLFKDIMARVPASVAVITTHDESGHHGLTVSSFTSLSLDPPLVLACIFNEIQSRDLIIASGSFTVNVLSQVQTFMAEQFSGQTPLADPEFSGVPHSIGTVGAARIDGCVSWLDCTLQQTYPAGDHTIIIGKVEALSFGDADDPLIYYDREFVELAWG